jgi:hypothetical protein
MKRKSLWTRYARNMKIKYKEIRKARRKHKKEKKSNQIKLKLFLEMSLKIIMKMIE